MSIQLATYSYLGYTLVCNFFFFGGWFAWHLIAALGQLQQCDYVFAFGRENDIYVVLHRLLGLLPVHVVFIGLLLALLPMAR